MSERVNLFEAVDPDSEEDRHLMQQLILALGKEEVKTYSLVVKVEGHMFAFNTDWPDSLERRGRWPIVMDLAAADDSPMPLAITKAAMLVGDGPVVIRYEYNSRHGLDRVEMANLWKASQTQVRQAIAAMGLFRPTLKGGVKTSPLYQPYIDRWRMGEDYEELRAEWEAGHPSEIPEYFYKAFWRAGYRASEDQVSIRRAGPLS